MISREEVQKLFELAKIDVTDEELLRLPQDLERILEYVSMLKDAPGAGEKPLETMAKEVNVWRRDEMAAVSEAERENLIASFPEKENDYLKTKKVFGS